MQRVTITLTRYHIRNHTRYHTFALSLTSVGHSEMHYHNFNVLPHVCVFTQFSMVLGLFATRYHALLSNLLKKCILIFFLKKLTVTHGNALQIASKPC